jgi:hypothetical protein
MAAPTDGCLGAVGLTATSRRDRRFRSQLGVAMLSPCGAFVTLTEAILCAPLIAAFRPRHVATSVN